MQQNIMILNFVYITFMLNKGLLIVFQKGRLYNSFVCFLMYVKTCNLKKLSFFVTVFLNGKDMVWQCSQYKFLQDTENCMVVCQSLFLTFNFLVCEFLPVVAILVFCQALRTNVHFWLPYRMYIFVTGMRQRII